MDTRKQAIVDGPDKPALQWSLTKPDHHVRFRLKDDAFDARILRMEEGADGFTFELHGRVVTGEQKDEPFDAVYSIESRSGWIQLHRAADQQS